MMAYQSAGGGPPVILNEAGDGAPVYWATADVTIDGQDVSGLVLALQPGMTLSGQVVFEGSAAPPEDLSEVRVSLAPAPVGGTTVHEDLDLGLEEALRMQFRPTAKQTVIVIGDAAAHRPEQSYTLRIASQYADSGPRRAISTLFVPTRSYLLGGRGDREFFQDLARAGGGGFNQHSGQLIEGVLLSVLED